MIILGIDEVGRGCWAGPLVAGAVILPDNFASLTETLKFGDSKTLNKKQRAAADQQIRELALAVGLGWVDAATIDRIGINKAVNWAIERALEAITINYDEIIIDGHVNFLSHNAKAKAVIKADASVPAVSAASIVAKVARDNYMSDIAHKYPGYGFDKHVGYGTALHLERLKLHGVSDLHRRSFKPIKSL